MNPVSGFVGSGHGVSVEADPNEVRRFGRVPHEVDLESIPCDLQVIRRGERDSHHEIVPNGVGLTPDEYRALLGQIRTL